MTQKVEKNTKIIIVGAGAFGISSAYHLAKNGYNDVTVFDKQPYDVNYYESVTDVADAASSDLNKIVRCSHYDDDYQQLALKSILEWEQWNDLIAKAKDLPAGLTNDFPVYVKSGYTRYYTEDMSKNQKEISSNDSFSRLGLSATQFELEDSKDAFRAKFTGLSKKLDPLDLKGKLDEKGEPIKSHLDITAGFAYASRATYFCYYLAKKHGVKFFLGPERGAFQDFLKENNKVKGITTKDGKSHFAEVVIVACGAWSPSLVPELQPINQATSGNIVLIHIPDERKDLLEKYSVKNFPVVAWKSFEFRQEGGGVFFFPITEPDHYLKFGARHTRWTNPVKTKDGKVISVPLTETSEPSHTAIPADALKTVTDFIEKYMPDVAELPITKTRLCWYAEAVNSDFIIDWVPNVEGLFICGGASAHGFKFLPTIGEFTVNVLEGVKNKYTEKFSWRKPEDNPSDIEKFKNVLEHNTLSSIDLKSIDGTCEKFEKLQLKQ
ncbi:hypothetical protein PACTADRAFT_2038 [Pachysolen tannophilus NRRL Y-2460]|uniref:FAD dependent oxidoreductase domain-containing protein n=1 Tax=Pachysolen tannophilus NRRL Y-2460 TaxID=669874 RepID=A0A1E4U0E5_PACTA|nr:hypothetical protein PACTADRAFT_2038 [Pachysolen tannophilus NRRL Y-2460]